MKRKFLWKLLILILALCLLASCNNNNNLDSNNDDKNEQNGKDEVQEPVKKEPIPSTVCYTANESGSISVIDIKTNKVIDTIKTDGAVNNVRVSYNGKILAASVSKDENTNGKVLFYNTENNELINETEIGKRPEFVEFSRDGKYAVVTNNKDNTASIIDMGNYKVIKTVNTGTGPNGIGIMRDSTLVFVANEGEDSLSIVSLVTLSHLNKIAVGKNPAYVSIAPDDRTILSALKGEDSLAIYDMSSGNIDKINIGKGPAQIYIQSDGKYAFAACEGTDGSPSNTITKVNLETKAAEATIQVGKGAHGVAASSDNKYIYVTNKYDSTVSVIDSAANKVIASIPVEKNPSGIALK